MNLAWSNIFYIMVRTTIIFIVLLFLTRILGKTQMSHLTFFNYVTGVTIGSIAGNMVSNNIEFFWDDLIGLIWICTLTILTGYINLKSGIIRRIIDGEPTIIIKKGEIIRHSLSTNRFNLDDLSMMLRKQNVFSITEVEYAILEPDGNLSVLKKPNNQEITKADIKIPAQNIKYIPSEIISDGKILIRNLKELNLTEEWLYKKLKQQNIEKTEDVFYAEIQTDGSLFIDKK